MPILSLHRTTRFTSKITKLLKKLSTASVPKTVHRIMQPTGTKEGAMAAVQDIFDRYHHLSERHSFNGYDTHVMKTAKLISAYPKTTTSLAKATFSLPIDSSYANINGVMHGGAAGVIFDMLTTTALGPIAKPGSWDFLGGVTRSLNISYLKPVPIGTTIKVKSEVMQAGKMMALIRGTMMNMEETVVYCTCEHHKANIPTREEHLVPLEGKHFSPKL